MILTQPVGCYGLGLVDLLFHTVTVVNPVKGRGGVGGGVPLGFFPVKGRGQGEEGS